MRAEERAEERILPHSVGADRHSDRGVIGGSTSALDDDDTDLCEIFPRVQRRTGLSCARWPDINEAGLPSSGREDAIIGVAAAKAYVQDPHKVQPARNIFHEFSLSDRVGACFFLFLAALGRCTENSFRGCVTAVVSGGAPLQSLEYS